MATGTRYPIVLPNTVRDLLEKTARSRTVSARERRNARILLLRADGVSYADCRRRVGCSRDAVCTVCRKFHQGGWEAVCRELPRGKPWSYPEADRQAVIAWAQTLPQSLGLPITRWSLSWLQRYWRRRKGTKPPARSCLRNWLKDAGIDWFRERKWCRSNDPDWLAKATAVCNAYLRADPDTAVLCYDQKPHLQALDRRNPLDPPIPGYPGRRDHDYIRRGVTCLHALLDVRTGRCRHACRDDHTAKTIAALVARWVRDRPEAKVLLICDNLSANHAPPVTAALQRAGKQVEVLRIPTYSSWLNQAERVFADFQRELLDRAVAVSVEDLRRQVRHWFAARNAVAQPFDWTYEPGLD